MNRVSGTSHSNNPTNVSDERTDGEEDGCNRRES